MISRAISRVTILITHIRGLIAPLITTHEPPSTEASIRQTDSSGLETDENSDSLYEGLMEPQGPKP